MTYLSSGSLTNDETWGKLDSSASGATEQPENDIITLLESEKTWHISCTSVTVISLYTAGQWCFVNL